MVSLSTDSRNVLIGMLCSSVLSAHASAAPVVYFGEDIGANGVSNLSNAAAAREDFISRLVRVGVEDFESLAPTTDLTAVGAPALSFAGLGTSAAVSGGSGGALVATLPTDPSGGGGAGGTASGRFPISGNQYVRAALSNRFDFVDPIAGFGLFITDCCEGSGSSGDENLGRIRIGTEREAGTLEFFEFENEYPQPGGGVLFFGVVDPEEPFDNMIVDIVSSTLDLPNRDSIGYDDVTVGQVPLPTALFLFASALGVGALRQFRILPRAG